MEEKKIVPNDVFIFKVAFEEFMYVNVFTKPFPSLDHVSEEKAYWEMIRQEELVQSKYFTKERIEELKEELIKIIRECENPFHISCVDGDSDYEVTEEELLDLG